MWGASMHLSMIGALPIMAVHATSPRVRSHTS